MARVAAAVCAIALSTVARVSAQTGANVLVVINEASPASVEIGEYYIAKRNIPADNVVRIRTAVRDDMDRGSFEFDIERPTSELLTRRGMQDRILYIVLTKGIPLRIRGTAGLEGTVSSVDSEVTMLYRRLIGMPAPPAGRIPNPYYLGAQVTAEAKRFSHANHDIYLVTRLDGYTVEDVRKLIDRGSAPSRNGIFVLDQRAAIVGNRIGDEWLRTAAERLTTGGLGDRVLLETTKAPAAGKTPALGYYSWGSNDPGIVARTVDIPFAPGALAGMFVSTDARTLTEPPPSWTLGRWGDQKGYFAGSPQSMTGDLVRAGVTGVAGHVAEPFLDGSSRPQILFPAYVAGFNLAESFYLSIPYVSWQNIVIGDPLCAPFERPSPTSEELTPPVDPETELPEFFSARRLALLASYDVRPEISRLMLKASARLLHSDLKGAAKALEDVTAIEPTLNAAHFVLATIYDVSGEFDRAIERYRVILSTSPNDVRALNNIAYALAVSKNMPTEALPFSEKAYSIAHENKVELTLDLGYAVAARKGTPPNVLPFAPVGYDVAGIKGQIADTLGWIHHLLGNEELAETYLKQAGNDSPGNPEVQFHVAVVSAAKGRTADARAALQKALAVDPKLAEREDVKALVAKIGEK
jgi:uncharacterized protein (TIGR03790 family)